MPPAIRYTRARDGTTIAYQVVGDGPLDMVYVPQSFSAVEHFWDHPMIARFFERLAALGRLILFDRRGSGMSDRVGPPATLEEQIDHVTAVLDAAGSEQAALFAIMEGGPMAMLFAASRPDRVRALVLHHTFARSTSAPGYEFAWDVETRRSAIEEYLEHWGDGSIIERFAPAHADDRMLRDWLGKHQRLGTSPGDAREVSALNEQVDVRHVLGSIRVPTLVLDRTGEAAFNRGHAGYLAEHIPGARLVRLHGDETLPFLGDTDELLGEIEEFLTGERRGRDIDRMLATVLFTDIVGSTERAATLGDGAWRSLLAEHDRRIRSCLARHDGREVKTVGDGFLATFDGPARAVRAAQAIARDVSDLGLEVRAGVHAGEVEVMDDDVGGMAVHIAARLVAIAQPGEVVASGTVKDLVVGSGLRFADRGEEELRGVPGSWRLWRVEE
jgi:class 3 adenylate cyclase